MPLDHGLANATTVMLVLAVSPVPLLPEQGKYILELKSLVPRAARALTRLPALLEVVMKISVSSTPAVAPMTLWRNRSVWAGQVGAVAWIVQLPPVNVALAPRTFRSSFTLPLLVAVKKGETAVPDRFVASNDSVP